MATPAQAFTDLLVWQKAHAWVLAIYRDTVRFPREELYGLVSQLRRAAVSIPASIAEGFKRRTAADKSRLYNISGGSAEEYRYHLILARDLGYLSANEADRLLIDLDEITRMLHRDESKVHHSA